MLSQFASARELTRPGRPVRVMNAQDDAANSHAPGLPLQPSPTIVQPRWNSDEAPAEAGDLLQLLEPTPTPRGAAPEQCWLPAQAPPPRPAATDVSSDVDSRSSDTSTGERPPQQVHIKEKRPQIVNEAPAAAGRRAPREIREPFKDRSDVGSFSIYQGNWGGRKKNGSAARPHPQRHRAEVPGAHPVRAGSGQRVH